VPQIIGVKERAVNSHVVSDPVDSTFDVLPPGVHRQQRVACTEKLSCSAPKNLMVDTKLKKLSLM